MTGLIIDNFAGGGGASTGIEAAIGRPVDIAINHDPEAIAMHAVNHPGTRHCCQSIATVDIVAETGGRKVKFAWYSPDCKHHSKAKGGKPRDKNIRDLADIVPDHIEALGDNAPDVIALENVQEFRDWGPLDDDDQPIKERRGEQFEAWCDRIRAAGYRIEFRRLRACDYGAPTSRERFYLIARRDGRPIAWPAPSHGKPGTLEVASHQTLAWRTAAECIDWTIPCRSIFDRERELKPATMKRIAHGVVRYVVKAAEPFIVGTQYTNTRAARIFGLQDPLRTANTQAEFGAVDAEIAPLIMPITHSGPPRANSAEEPVRTLTCANRGELALVGATLIQAGYGERDGQAPRVPHCDKPLGAVVAGGVKHAAVTAFLSQFYSSNKRGSGGELREPGKAATAEGQHQAIVCAHMEQANTGMVGHAMRDRVSTIVGKGCTQRLVETTLIDADALPADMMDRAVKVAAFLIKYYGAAEHGQPAEAPLDAITAKARFAVVTVTIDATTYVIVDIGMRMLTPRELARAQGFPDSYVLNPIGPNGRALSKSAQIRMIGNSVCPDVAEALVRANLPELCTGTSAASVAA